MVLIFAYVALGPYASIYQQALDSIKGPFETAFRAVKNALYDIYLLATNPTEWYARQQVVNARPEKPISFPKSLEVTQLDATPSSVPGGQPFVLTFVLKNEGDLPVKNVKAKVSCNQFCDAPLPKEVTEIDKDPFFLCVDYTLQNEVWCGRSCDQYLGVKQGDIVNIPKYTSSQCVDKCKAAEGDSGLDKVFGGIGYAVGYVGGGAAGMLAAGAAAAGGKKVLLLEKNPELGKKLLITGKGRCNITNAGDLKNFIACYGSGGKFLYRALTVFSNQQTVELFNRLGVETKVERGGRIFPVSDMAETVVGALKKYLAEGKVEILVNMPVRKILAAQGAVTGVAAGNSEYYAKKVIIGTGGLSYPGTGSTGDGYRFAELAGHGVVEPRPSLVPLVSKDNFVRELQGLSLRNVEALLYAGNVKVVSEFGEMLFTHFGLSGPIILTLSSFVPKLLKEGKNVRVSINLKPALTNEQLNDRLIREFKDNARKTYSNILKNLLPMSLVNVFVVRSGIGPDKKGAEISKVERGRIVGLLGDFSVSVSGTRPIAEAIVTGGGVALDEINPRTMESLKVKGLFFCGEVIDIDGLTGGYNLQAAFSTGYLAGVS